jgi:hypothetical protein
MEVSGQLYASGKRPLYSLDKGLGGTQSRSERRGVEKNPFPLSGIEPRYKGWAIHMCACMQSRI